MNYTKRSCLYWQACGSNDNCKDYKGYKKNTAILKAQKELGQAYLKHLQVLPNDPNFIEYKKRIREYLNGKGK